jgi:hypothetical protein
MTITKRISGAPSGGSTKRVTESAAGTERTERVPHLLLLEGDMQVSGHDCLLLEGDMQSGTDALKLEGDATAVGGTVTKRIAESVG